MSCPVFVSTHTRMESHFHPCARRVPSVCDVQILSRQPSSQFGNTELWKQCGTVSDHTSRCSLSWTSTLSASQSDKILKGQLQHHARIQIHQVHKVAQRQGVPLSTHRRSVSSSFPLIQPCHVLWWGSLGTVVTLWSRQPYGSVRRLEEGWRPTWTSPCQIWCSSSTVDTTLVSVLWRNGVPRTSSSKSVSNTKSMFAAQAFGLILLDCRSRTTPHQARQM